MANATSIATPCNSSTITEPSLLWYEEELGEGIRWRINVKRVLHNGRSKFQEMIMLDTHAFGKFLILGGQMQSAEMDDWVYHECLVHPALLLHPSPKNVFIMGGGPGSAAREVLRHRNITKVVMCDLDEEVVQLCRAELTANQHAFRSDRLEVVIDDARVELKRCKEEFDIIIGDLLDLIEWGPCHELYTKSFYEDLVKPKLSDGGIFVTNAGPAGVLTHQRTFTSIYNTLNQVFAHVITYTAHVPSFGDTWGWVMASDHPLRQVSSGEIDKGIKERIEGELRYLDGATFHASTMLNKIVRQR